MNENAVTKDSIFKRYGGIHLVLTCMIGFLFAGNSIAGIMFSDLVYPIPDIYNSFLPNDYINLFFGIPILILSVVLALRALKIGLAGWAASLMFALYNAIAYLFAVRNTFSMIVSAFIVLLCIVELILMALSLNHETVSAQAPHVRHSRIYGSILIAIGLIFVLRALANIIKSAGGYAGLSLPEVGVNIADVIVCSLWIISGILLIVRQRFGFFAGLISYLHGSILFLSLMAFLIIQPLLCGMKFSVADLAVIGIMSLVLIVPSVLLVRKLSQRYVPKLERFQ
jgi:hypothetical protein